MLSVTLTVPTPFLQRWRQRAAAEDLPFSTWIRHAIRHYESCQKSERQDTDGNR